jgi:hypothetical protein
MIGEKMTITKSIADLGKATRFGADWPGARCGAQTRRGSECQRPAYKHNGRCGLHGGRSTGAKTAEGLKRISEANLKHGRYTKDKLERQRRAAEVGRQIRTELKLIEQRFVKAGLLYR